MTSTQSLTSYLQADICLLSVGTYGTSNTYNHHLHKASLLQVFEYNSRYTIKIWLGSIKLIIITLLL